MKIFSLRILAHFLLLAPKPPQNYFFELVMVTNLLADHNNLFLGPGPFVIDFKVQKPVCYRFGAASYFYVDCGGHMDDVIGHSGV